MVITITPFQIAMIILCFINYTVVVVIVTSNFYINIIQRERREHIDGRIIV
jgi:hypothetical protein